MNYRMVAVAILGALGIVLGAMGAHSLRPHLTDVAFNSYETGVRYHFLHTLLLAILALAVPTDRFKWSFGLTTVGTILFSGSIYLLSTKALHGIEAVKMLGLVTPLGGLVLICGWLALAFESRNLNLNK